MPFFVWYSIVLSYVFSFVFPQIFEGKKNTEYIGGFRSISVAERLALPTSDHRVAGLNPAGGKILSEPKWRFIA